MNGETKHIAWTVDVRPSPSQRLVSPVALIIGALFVGIFLWMRNYIGIIVLLLALVAYVLMRRYSKGIHHIVLDVNGISIDGKLYKFDQWDSFWIFYNPPDLQEISLVSKRSIYSPQLRIPLGEEDPNHIREFLVQFMPEKKQEETFIDVWIRRLDM